MGRLGFEPRTNRLKAEYSTVELATQPMVGVAVFLSAQFLTVAQGLLKVQGENQKKVGNEERFFETILGSNAHNELESTLRATPMGDNHPPTGIGSVASWSRYLR